METTTEAPKPELSPTKVIAGAGAAVTSAVLGSFFGADGTVVGAAFGSVASTVAGTVYQRSLDRTRDTLVARVRVRRPGDPAGGPDPTDPEATVRLPPVDADGPVGPVLDEPAPRRRRWLLWTGVTALVFALAMAVITGIEVAKGSTIAGNEGTSVGRVVERPPAGPDEEGSGTTGTDPDTTATPEPTPEPDGSTTTPDPEAPGGAEGDAEDGRDGEPAPEDGPDGSGDVRPTERNAPGDDAVVPDGGSGTGAGGASGTGFSSRFGTAADERFADAATTAAATTTAATTTVAPPTTRP